MTPRRALSRSTQLFRASVLVLTLLGIAIGSALPARAVEVQEVVSPNGLKALLVEDHTNPIISMEIAFRGGAALDPLGKEGLAHLASGLLDEGAGELDSEAFQAALADLSIQLSFDAGLDAFSGSLRTLTENRDEAFRLLKLALTEPRFDSEPVTRIRGQIQASLRHKQEDPSTIAGQTLRRLFFGGHVYERETEGTSETIAAVTKSDLKSFVVDRLARDVLYVAVVGDMTAEELSGLLDSTFGSLPATSKAQRVPETTAKSQGDLVIIEKDVPQSVVTFGHAGLKRDDPDYYTAYVVNYILGGGSFSSRLYSEIREKRGLAYSVYSYLSPFDHSALVVGGVATANARVATSIELVRQEWSRMASEGPTKDELEEAKTYLTGSFPLRLSSSGAIARMLLGIQLADLGSDYLDERNSYIEAVTLEDARRVAGRLFDANALTLVVVGAPQDLEATRKAPGEEG